ncbi:MAG: NAD(P)-binding domain-containing protein [Halofilum sp. (in: g-proteobacteria)]|nr:NAD(P)-binding domain-containing protein [Halofilum sp. (in: g-proteobacteria)]
MQIGFIGTGRITRRLVAGAAGQGHSLVVTRRSEAVSAELAAAHGDVEVVESAQDVVDRCDTVFLCLPVEVARETLPDVRFHAGQSVISVMVGFTLEELLAVAAPAEDVAITVPMPSIAHGGCPLPVFPNTGALEAIYGDRNPVIPLADEAALQQFFAVTGTVLPVLQELRTMSDWLAEQTGDPATAERYVTALYGGYLAQLGSDADMSLDAAIDDLSIAGGLNATLRERLKASGHFDDLHAGLDALLERLKR